VSGNSDDPVTDNTGNRFAVILGYSSHSFLSPKKVLPSRVQAQTLSIWFAFRMLDPYTSYITKTVRAQVFLS